VYLINYLHTTRHSTLVTQQQQQQVDANDAHHDAHNWLRFVYFEPRNVKPAYRDGHVGRHGYENGNLSSSKRTTVIRENRPPVRDARKAWLMRLIAAKAIASASITSSASSCRNPGMHRYLGIQQRRAGQRRWWSPRLSRVLRCGSNDTVPA